MIERYDDFCITMTLFITIWKKKNISTHLFWVVMGTCLERWFPIIFFITCTPSWLFSLFFFPCTDVFPEFGQSCPFIRNGRSSGPTCFSRQIAEFHGRKRHTYHPMSDHFEKPSRSLPTVPVYQGTGRLLRGKLKVPIVRFRHPPKRNSTTSFSYLSCSTLFVDLFVVCLFPVHKTENVEGHCGSIRHWSFLEWSLYVEEALRQKFTALWMLLRSWGSRSRPYLSSGD